MIALVCDIGGTNSRLGLVADGALIASSTASFANDDFGTFDAIAADYLRAQDIGRVDAVCIALAAFATVDGATLTNRDWTIRRDRIAALSGAGRVAFINDFAALGHALGRVGKLRTQVVSAGPARMPAGPRLVLGAGTGFNAAVWLPGPAGAAQVLAAECGHMTLPLAGADEFHLQAHLSQGRGRASIERALSGRGLVEIYQWQCQRAGRPQRFSSGADISRHAVAGSDEDCIEAGAMFLHLLGRVCGDLALAYLPLGGLYLSGGVTRAFAPILPASEAFRGAFHAKGRQAAFMEGFAVHLLLDDDTALHGCAEWLQGAAGAFETAV